MFPLICLGDKVGARVAGNQIRESKGLEIVAQIFIANIVITFSDFSPIETHTASDKSGVVVILMANGPERIAVLFL